MLIEHEVIKSHKILVSLSIDDGGGLTYNVKLVDYKNNVIDSRSVPDEYTIAAAEQLASEYIPNVAFLRYSRRTPADEHEYPIVVERNSEINSST